MQNTWKSLYETEHRSLQRVGKDAEKREKLFRNVKVNTEEVARMSHILRMQKGVREQVAPTAQNGDAKRHDTGHPCGPKGLSAAQIQEDGQGLSRPTAAQLLPKLSL